MIDIELRFDFILGFSMLSDISLLLHWRPAYFCFHASIMNYHCHMFWFHRFIMHFIFISLSWLILGMIFSSFFSAALFFSACRILIYSSTSANASRSDVFCRRHLMRAAPRIDKDGADRFISEANTRYLLLKMSPDIHCSRYFFPLRPIWWASAILLPSSKFHASLILDDITDFQVFRALPPYFPQHFYYQDFYLPSKACKLLQMQFLLAFSQPVEVIELYTGFSFHDKIRLNAMPMRQQIGFIFWYFHILFHFLCFMPHRFYSIWREHWFSLNCYVSLGYSGSILSE